MRKISIILIGLLTFLSFSSIAQNTLGVINNTPEALNGYTLFTTSTETYLINNCGQVINHWTSGYPSGHAVYLLENGNLLRAGRVDNPFISLGGIGGRIELFNWEGSLLWSYNYSTDQVSQHHDIYPMPNGNVLVLAATIMSNAEAIQAGRNPANLPESILYNEQIIELEPTGTSTANIVWEWNINDHLIQDFDNSKDNYGIVADNPQLLNINYFGNSTTGVANWLHVNSMQYNETLDQIVIGSRLLSEVYIIDHSTTTTEAGTHAGGTYGKGGDFLYRWGNPAAYNQGTSDDQQLFGQHYPHFIPNGLPNEGKLILFNNGTGRQPSFSEIFIVTPPTTSSGVYLYNPNTSYGPETPDYIYKDPIDETLFLAKFLSGAQQLPNGNILICDGDSGYFFEIDSNENKVWEYINPVTASGILTQGDNPFGANTVFRATKYDSDYPAFTGRDLTPGDPIELNFDISSCEILAVADYDISDQLNIFPNPTSGKINIESNFSIDRLEIYDLFGRLIRSERVTNSIDIESLASGVYFAKVYSDNKFGTKKIVKQ